MSVVLLASVFALAPAVPALPVAGCDAIAFAEESLQNDARGGGDAPDTADAPRRVEADGYYTGYLSAVGHANADREDWYVYAVPSGIEAMHANITSEFPIVPTYTVELPTHVQVFTLTVFPPDGSPPVSITPHDETLVISSPPSGEYLVRVTATTLREIDECGPAPAPPPAPAGTSHARNHGFYLGCDPLCAEGGPMSPGL